MTTPSYAPTVNPGDTRRRTRYIGIRTNLDGYTVEVLEQDVIRLASGTDKVLEDLGGISVAMTPAELARVIPIKNPADDSDTGEALTTGQILAGVYSWVREHQRLRDEAAATTP
jgi:hypothetical protein